MRVGILYYSRTGNTRHVAEILEKKLKEKKINVDLIKVEAVKKPNFLKAGYAAIRQKDLPIKNTAYDFKDYAVIIAGTPIWAGKPAPFLKTFIKKAINLKGKKGAIFVTGVREPSTQIKAEEMIKNDLEKHGVNQINASLVLKMKNRQIIEGERKINGFIMDIFAK